MNRDLIEILKATSKVVEASGDTPTMWKLNQRDADVLAQHLKVCVNDLCTTSHFLGGNVDITAHDSYCVGEGGVYCLIR